MVKDKPQRRDEVLFIDARKLATMISRVQCGLKDEVIARIAGTVAAWRGGLLPLPQGEGRGEGGSSAGIPVYEDIPGYCRSVRLAEIVEHGHVLAPGRYVGAEAVDDDEGFEAKMQAVTERLGEQMAKGAELDMLIRQKLGGLGYEL